MFKKDRNFEPIIPLANLKNLIKAHKIKGSIEVEPNKTAIRRGEIQLTDSWDSFSKKGQVSVAYATLTCPQKKEWMEAHKFRWGSLFEDGNGSGRSRPGSS